MRNVEQRISSTGNIIKLAAVLLAILPSIAVLVGIVPIPPSVEQLVKFVSGALGIVIILSVILLREVIAKATNAAIGFISFTLMIAGAAAATQYLAFTSRHMIYPYGGERPVLLPLEPSAELRSLMSPYGEDYTEALATSVQRERIEELLQRESASSLFTIVLLLILAQVLVVGAIVLAAWKLAQTDRGVRRKRAS